jgi:hypothetical protein
MYPYVSLSQKERGIAFVLVSLEKQIEQEEETLFSLLLYYE